MADKILIAVLAAGASRRLGQPKQLVKLNGEPLIRRACRTAISAQIGPVVVILGCLREQIALAVSDLPLEIVINDAWDEGMASSVRAATLAAQSLEVDALLLLHADQYAITSQDLRHLHDAWQTSPAAAYLSRAGNHLGPPAILPASLFDQMLTLVGESGPKSILDGHTHVVEIAMPAASRDVDQPLDLESAR